MWIRCLKNIGFKNHRVFNAEVAETQSFSCFSLHPLRLCDLCVYNTLLVSSTTTQPPNTLERLSESFWYRAGFSH